MSASRRRSVGATVIWLGVLVWLPFIVLIMNKQSVSIFPFLALHLSGVLGGWSLRQSADRMEGSVQPASGKGRRRKIVSRVLIYIGVLAWAPYLYLDKIAGVETAIGPFLAAHLTGVLSGVALRLSVEFDRSAQQP
ncbi:MAG TPA: hypothetical protein VFF70_11450 [Anaerolineae bacterium]|nr:hypothetical protein [Anaerolineae bacterium]